FTLGSPAFSMLAGNVGTGNVGTDGQEMWGQTGRSPCPTMMEQLGWTDTPFQTFLRTDTKWAARGCRRFSSVSGFLALIFNLESLSRTDKIEIARGIAAFQVRGFVVLQIPPASAALGVGMTRLWKRAWRRDDKDFGNGLGVE